MLRVEPTAIVCSILIISISIGHVHPTAAKRNYPLDSGSVKHVIGPLKFRPFASVHQSGESVISTRRVLLPQIAIQATKPKALLLIKSFKVAQDKQKADAKAKVYLSSVAKKPVIAKLNLKPIVSDLPESHRENVAVVTPTNNVTNLLSEMVKILKEKMLSIKNSAAATTTVTTSSSTTVVSTVKLGQNNTVNKKASTEGDTASLIAEMVKLLKDKMGIGGVSGSGVCNETSEAISSSSSSSSSTVASTKAVPASTKKISAEKRLKLAINKFLPKQVLRDRNDFGVVYPVPYDGMEGLRYLPLVLKDSAHEKKRPAAKKLALFSLDND